MYPASPCGLRSDPQGGTVAVDSEIVVVSSPACFSSELYWLYLKPYFLAPSASFSWRWLHQTPGDCYRVVVFLPSFGSEQ